MRRSLLAAALALATLALGAVAPEPAGAVTIPQGQWVPAYHRDCAAEVRLGQFGTDGYLQMRTSDADCSRHSAVAVEVWRGGVGRSPWCSQALAPGNDPWGCTFTSSGRTGVTQAAVTQATAIGGWVQVCSIAYGCKGAYHVSLYPE